MSRECLDISEAYHKYSLPFQTQDGFVICYENPIECGGGFYAKTYSGELVYEKYPEDLYVKHDVHIYNALEDCKNET
jgi:hypothetical protein